MPDEEDNLEEGFDRPSKSQIKRELDELKDLGARLVELSADQLSKLSEPKLIEAINMLRSIHRGSARKRQVQYIGKLLRDESLAAEARAILDRLDASSRAHVQAFHRLEQWRDRLMNEDPNVMDEICGEFPAADRQHLRQLARRAAQEQKKNESAKQPVPPVNYRKLFQYLRELSENNSGDS